MVLSPRVRANIMVVTGVAIWATGFPATEVLLETWGPVPLVSARLMVGGLVILLAMALAGRLTDLARLPWRQIAFVGLCGVGCSTVFLVVGQRYSDPVTVSIIATGLPLVAAVAAYFAGDEVLGPRIYLGVAFAIAGGVMTSLAASEGGLGFRGGEIFSVCAVILFTWYSRSLVRRLGGLSDFAATSSTLLAGGLLLIPFTALAVQLDLIDGRTDFSWQSLGLIVWVGGVTVGLTLVLWRAGIRVLGVTIAGIYHNSGPFWVMLFVFLTGGEVFLGQVWGAALVILGALFAQLPLDQVRAWIGKSRNAG